MDPMFVAAFTKPCRKIHEVYEKDSYLSQGTYGLVFKAIEIETNEVVAIKQVKLTDENSNLSSVCARMGFPITALREINVLLSLSHPNIIRVREMVVGTSMDQIYMVMDYYQLDLSACLKRRKQPFSTSEVKQLFLQLMSGVEHMHSHWYLHRDLKTSNILYNNNTGQLCICDFGLARKYGSPIAPYTFEVVTLYYRAPELLLGGRTYGPALDIWSVGCILGELVLGDVLFPGQGEIDQISKIFRAIGAPNEEKWPGFSVLPLANKVTWKASTKGKLREIFPGNPFSGGVYLDECGLDLVQRLLCMDPNARITGAAALEHSWVTSQPPMPADLCYMPRFD